MKKLLFAVLAIFALYSCGEKAPSYTIKGVVNISELEGAQVLLTLTENRVTTTIDSATVNQGSFELKGAVEQPKIYSIRINGAEKSAQTDLVLENAEIAVVMDENGNKVSGTPTNEAYQQYKDEISAYYKQMGNISEEYKNLKDAGSMTQAIEDSLSMVMEDLDAKTTEIGKTFATSNINNPAGQNILRSISYKLSVDEQKQIIAGANEATMQTDVLKTVTQRIEALENTAVGKPYTDLRYPNPEGTEIALSDYVGKNKVVLVDFWASWCPPCRADMPNVVAAYNKYKSKGFEIVGVSLDRTHDAWVKGIEELNITWPQMSEVKFWDTEAIKLYGVSSIPHMVLIDQEGTIIARGIHGDELDKMLGDLLK